MRTLCIVILLCAPLFSHAQATVSDAIKFHEKWMEENIPSPADLLVDSLLIYASDAISSYAHEKENIRIIEACTRLIPELQRIADLKKSGTMNGGFIEIVSSLVAISEKAEEMRLSEEIRAKCMFNLLKFHTSNTMFLTIAEKFLALQELAFSKNPSSENQEWLYLAKLTTYYGWYLNDLHPLDLLREIFRTEKEILEFYRQNPTINSVAKSEIYSILGILFFNPDSFLIPVYDEYFKVYQDSYQHRVLMGRENDEFDFPEIGYFYTTQSLKILESLLHPYHPDLAVSKMNFAFQTMFYGDNTENIRQLNDYIEFLSSYFPQGTHLVPEANLKLETAIYYSGEEPSLRTQYDDKATIKLFYGETSEKYLIFLANLAYLNAAKELRRDNKLSQSLELFSECRQVSEKLYRSDPVCHIKILSDQMDYFALADGNRYRGHLDEAERILSELKRTDWSVLAVCKRLVKSLTMNGVYQRAVPLQEKVIHDATTLVGKDHHFYANQLYNLAQIQSYNKDFSNASKNFREAIDILEKNGEYAADIYHHYSAALLENNEVDEAIQLRQMLLGNLDPNIKIDYAYSLCLLGEAYLKQGDKQTAEIDRVFSEAIGLYRDHINELYPETARGYTLIAQYYKFKNDKTEELNYLLSAHEYYSLLNIPGNEKPEAKGLLIDYYMDNNLDEEAEKLIDENIVELERKGQINTLEYIGYQWYAYNLTKKRNPGNMILQLGKFLPIISAMQERIIICDMEKSFGLTLGSDILCEMMRIFTTWMNRDMIEEYKANRSQINEFDRNMMDSGFQNLEFCFEQICELKDLFERQKETGYNYEADYHYISLIRSLADYYSAFTNDMQTTERYYFDYLELVRNLDDKYPEMVALNVLAHYYLNNRNEYEKALYYFKEAQKHLNITNDLYDRNINSSGLVKCHVSLGLYDESLPHALEYYEQTKRLVKTNFDFMTALERESFIDHYSDGTTFISELLPYFPEKLAPVLYDASLYSKGLLLRSQKRIRQSIIASGDEDAISDLAALEELGRQVRAAGSENITESGTLYWEIQKKIEDIEKRLMFKSEAFRQSKEEQNITWQEIQKALKKDEAAVEFIFGGEGYYALILREKFPAPAAVKLFDFDNVAVNDFLRVLNNPTERDELKISDLYGDENPYSVFWGNIETHLNGCNTVYYSPIGMLNQVSFTSLLCGENTRLHEKYSLIQLSSTAEIAKQREQSQSPKSVAVFSDIDYGGADRGVANDNRSSTRSDSFDYLPGTKKEGEYLTSFFRENKFQVFTFNGSNATEAELMDLQNKSPQIIHLATHGFFIAEEHVHSTTYYDRFPTAKFQSMQRSGLVLANANEAWTGAVMEQSNDGIVTANEISTLNLGQTELVVLSACQTALGNAGKEGVYGIQRGFKLAGVSSLIVTLWETDDEATSYFMTIFYNEWLNNVTLSKQKAFDKAIDLTKAKYADPYYWGAFVLIDGID